jgi:hypothetical protein
LGAVEHGGDLGNPDARHHPRGANRAGPDADLDRVGAGGDERLGGLGGGHVAGDDVDVPVRLHLGQRVDDRAGVAVGGVDDEHVDTPVDEGLAAIEHVGARAHRGGHPQAAPAVLGGVRVGDALLDVLDGDEP